MREESKVSVSWLVEKPHACGNYKKTLISDRSLSKHLHFPVDFFAYLFAIDAACDT